ncbi:MAG TPA: hypothetical protein VFH83_14025, partial [Spirochaetia bacterium]|nr:hypothetical protein [Spirochaetia bacterium]
MSKGVTAAALAAFMMISVVRGDALHISLRRIVHAVDKTVDTIAQAAFSPYRAAMAPVQRGLTTLYERTMKSAVDRAVQQV